MKEQMKLCKQLVQESIDGAITLNNGFAQLSELYGENPEEYKRLMAEDEEFKELEEYLSSRDAYIFGLIENIQKITNKY